MPFDNPESGEALVGAFEIMAERMAQVAESVQWIEHIVEIMPEEAPQPATTNVVNLVQKHTNTNYPRRAA